MTKNNINTNKRAYQKPSMLVYQLNHQPQLLNSSPDSMPLHRNEPTSDQGEQVTYQGHATC